MNDCAMERNVSFDSLVPQQQIAIRVPMPFSFQSDESSDKQMSCIVSLLNFYQNEPSREELFLRYIYKLHDLHMPAENLVEAAFTLKLHADLLKWSNRTLHADLR